MKLFLIKNNDTTILTKLMKINDFMDFKTKMSIPNIKHVLILILKFKIIFEKEIYSL